MAKEQRTKAYLGEVKAVVYYPNRGLPKLAVRMMAVKDFPTASGQFFCDGENIHFHKDDFNDEKFVVYESVVQVQVTARRCKKIRLRA